MKINRLEYIAEVLEKKGKVSVAELSQSLNCSEVTIRSDIQKMEEKGLARKVHGGAVKAECQLKIGFDPGNIFSHVEEKMRIAEKAYTYIQDRDTIILDDASVNYYLAQKISENNSKSLVVITNSLVCAGVLSTVKHVELFTVGGQIGGKLASAMGDLAVNTIQAFHADKAFISAHGVNFSAGVTSIGSPQMQVKKAILEASQEVYLLVDSSKFGGGYVLVVCPLDMIHTVITDKGIDDENIQLAKKHDVKIDIV